MPINRNIAFLVGTSLVLGAISTSALAQSKHTDIVATRDVRQLIQMMDKDKNGTVSKEEFMDFMSQTFDRLDVNKSGQLEPQELRRLTRPDWPGPPEQPGASR
jgi:Ca2+-binding EF-hand superfamily protein